MKEMGKKDGRISGCGLETSGKGREREREERRKRMKVGGYRNEDERKKRRQ